MSKHRLHKQRRAQRIEMLIRREIFNAETILDQNAQAMGVLTMALDNEPRALKQAFAEIKMSEGGAISRP
jgi:metal-responsive CopG/Arc/MetJ family transcriptional regulator